MKKILLITTLLVVFVSFMGCQFSGVKDTVSSQQTSIQGIKDINLDTLCQFKNSYVGDNSAVGGIIYNLPGSIFVKQFSLTSDSITVDYGIKEGSQIKVEDLNQYWQAENTEKVFLNNATTLFILIKNVEQVKFNLDTAGKQSFSISRKEMETFYGKDLKEYAQDKSLWKKEILEGTLQSSEDIEKFFKTHAISVSFIPCQPISDTSLGLQSIA